MTVRKDTAEWLEERRKFITSTAIPVILGISPYRCEQDLADEMNGIAAEPSPEHARFMRIGKAMEPAIRAEDEIEHGIKLRSVNRFIVHPTIPWAATSLDFERVGERCIVEAKDSERGDWRDGLPQDVEAQVRWQMGCAGYPRAHVAHIARKRLTCFDLEHEEATFGNLVTVAADFYERWKAGGPFAQNVASIKRRHPSDNGEEMVADPDLSEAVLALIGIRERKHQLELDEEKIETAIKTRIGDCALVQGAGWHVTWRRTKDRVETNWESIALSVLPSLAETERTALVGRCTIVRPGFRPLRIVQDKEIEP